MRVRDPESKKRQLINAALTEFAAHGLAGGRVDAIAQGAGCSSGLVYTYFGSKEGLFDAVLTAIATTTTESVPITGDDLPGYAERLHQAGQEHPEVARFVTWYQLERDPLDVPPVPDASVAHKVEVIREAQERGIVRDDISPRTLAISIQAIARMWVTNPRTVVDAVDPDGDEQFRRESIRTAVQALISPR
jgi:AcrR family transcriptional regulator